MTNPTGESDGEAPRPDFDRWLKVQFLGSVATSDAGLLAYRELDEALGLSDMTGETLADARTAKMAGMLSSECFDKPSLDASPATGT